MQDLKKKKKKNPCHLSLRVTGPLSSPWSLWRRCLGKGSSLSPAAGRFYSVARDPELKPHADTGEEGKAHGSTVGPGHLGTELGTEEIRNRPAIHFPGNPMCPRKNPVTTRSPQFVPLMAASADGFASSAAAKSF